VPLTFHFQTAVTNAEYEQFFFIFGLTNNAKGDL